MRCEKCQSELSPDARFCSACGHPVAAVTTLPLFPDIEAQPPLSNAGDQPSDVPGAARSSPAAAVPAGGMVRGTSLLKLAARLAAVGGFVLAALATFLPWYRVRFLDSGSIIYSGWDDHYAQAVVTLVLAGVGVLTLIGPLLYVRVRRAWWIQVVPVIAGILIAAVGVLTYAKGEDERFSGTDFIVEIGLYVLIAGAIVAAVVSLLGQLGRRPTTESS